MKTQAVVKPEVALPIRPLIHPNTFPGMKALGDLIFEHEERFQKGLPTQQVMFDQLWGSFNDLWNSVDTTSRFQS